MVPFKTISLTTSQSATIGTTLSARGIVYAQGGNSSLWNSSYNTSTTYQSTSSNFVYQQITSFTPTVGDWYRIITGSVMMGGTIKIGGAYNNQVTDVEFQFNMAGYGTGGSIQQTRFSSFNNGNVSQVRIGANPSAGNFVYLDINVGGSSGAYAPLYIQYTPNTGPYTATLVTSPVSGATVPSTSAGYYYLLSLAHGFRTTNSVIGNSIQDLAGNTLDLKANINSPTFTGTVGGITKTMVGLGNVDNTSDANKPVSTATQTLIQSTSALLTPLTVTRTLTGQLLLTSVYQGASGNWQSTYTTVQSNSASWEESADILPTVTNYLSTNNVLISGLNVTNNLTVDTNTLFVNSINNRVGIGTTSPASPLHIKVPATTHANLIIDNTTSNYWSSLDFYSAGSAKWGIGLNRNTVNSSLDFFDITNSKAIMTILQNSGNVGIGTAAPNERLTVSGNISATGTVFASAANISGDIVANRIQATVKNFYIKHPTKPDKHLVYSSLETPYNGIQLTGEDEIVNGLCVVELPGYLNNLIHLDSVHIQLTNYQHSKSLYVDRINIDQNNFTVKCDSWFSKSQKLKFFWLLNGVRKDIERLETEV